MEPIMNQKKYIYLILLSLSFFATKASAESYQDAALDALLEDAISNKPAHKDERQVKPVSESNQLMQTTNLWVNQATDINQASSLLKTFGCLVKQSNSMNKDAIPRMVDQELGEPLRSVLHLIIDKGPSWTAAQLGVKESTNCSNAQNQIQSEIAKVIKQLKNTAQTKEFASYMLALVVSWSLPEESLQSKNVQNLIQSVREREFDSLGRQLEAVLQENPDIVIQVGSFLLGG